MTRLERHKNQLICIFKDDGAAWIYIDTSISKAEHKRILAQLQAEFDRRHALGVPAANFCKMRVDHEEVKNDFTPAEYGEIQLEPAVA